MENAFVPFSTSPRACIGRNLTGTEMTVFLGNWFHRYELVVERPHSKVLSKAAYYRRFPAYAVGLHGWY
ncbi:hypothetical protein BDY19DRAFT_995405 [Irpex rosettiformis]|uniref:Uncharacterized protein n=1 Tax=Irpex rosettiformis TaxID=378272 RepID=A0ACB8TY55_9APHY|nr:hypothetical protein BDY19DRAFT_995405 [Irpex rosettiformis]